MKTRLLISLSLGLLSLGSTIASVEAAVCDQTFAPRVMRYGFGYNLYDEISNPNSFDQWLSNASVEIAESADFNLG